MRKILIPLVFAPVAMLIALLSGCGGGDPNPKIKDKAPTELEKKKPGGAGDPKPQAN